jgi:hypothetical protein
MIDFFRGKFAPSGVHELMTFDLERPLITTVSTLSSGRQTPTLYKPPNMDHLRLVVLQ